jgi:hypothetical protein
MIPVFPRTLDEMYSTGFVTDDKNERREALSSTVSRPEAEILMRAVQESNALTTLEVGVAFGASAIAICSAKAGNKIETSCHYGVDPNQGTYYNNAAIVGLEKEELLDYFILLPGPSHWILHLLTDGTHSITRFWIFIWWIRC